MRISQVGIALLKKYEKGPNGTAALVAYQDGGGVWTIGWGHTKGVHRDMVCTRAQAEAWLDEDCRDAEELVLQGCTVEPNQNQFDALVCLAFNIPRGYTPGKKKPAGAKDGFLNSTVLRMHNEGRFAEAAQAFAMWNKDQDASGRLVPLRGITLRRADEARLYLTPTIGEEEVSPLRTRGSSVEASVPANHLLDRGVKVGMAAAGAGSVINQCLTQFNDVWNSLQAITGGYGAHVLTAITGLMVIGGIGYVIYTWLKRRA